MDQTMRETLRVLWRRRILIGILALAGVVGALWHSAGQQKSFTASTTFVIRPVLPSAVFTTFQGGTQAGPLGLDLPAVTQAQLVDSRVVADRVVKVLGIDATTDDLIDAVSAKAVSDQLIQVTASWPRKREAVAMADAFANEYIKYRREQTHAAVSAVADDLTRVAASTQARVDKLDAAIVKLSGQIAGLDPKGNPKVASTKASFEAQVQRLTEERNEQLVQLNAVRSRAADIQVGQTISSGAGEVIQPAVLPTRPSSPKPKRDVVLGFILGLLLGVGVALVMHFLANKVRTRDDAARAAGVPVLAAIPQIRRWRRRREAYLVMKSDPASRPADSFRALRASLLASGVGGEVRRVLVTSAEPREGKTQIAANLAVALAGGGVRTLLISADFKNPRLHQFFGTPSEPGFSAVLEGKVDLARAISATQVANLGVIGSGTPSINASDLLASPRLGEVLAAVDATGAVVVIDTPALSESADALSIAAAVKSSLLVVETESADTSDVARASAQLNAAGAPPMGVVLNWALAGDETAGIGERDVEPATSSTANGHYERRALMSDAFGEAAPPPAPRRRSRTPRIPSPETE